VKHLSHRMCALAPLRENNLSGSFALIIDPMPFIRRDALRTLSPLALVAAVGPVLYFGGWLTVAITDDELLGQATCFDSGNPSHLNPTRVAAAALMALGAILLLWFVPWLLGTLAFRRIERKRATAHAWSLAANSAALVVVCLVLRETVGIARESFLGAWLAWTALLVILAARRPGCRTDFRSLARRYGPPLAVGVLAVGIGIVLFHREHFLQCFNGDGTEFDELARSLRLHFLPYWEIEPVSQFGTFVANPTLINSYWTLALHVLLGGGELATRLPFWIWWLSAFAVALRLCFGIMDAEPRDMLKHNLRVAIPLALLVLLAASWYTFYTGYDPYLADVANPGVPDALFALLVLLALDCLRRGDAAGWVAMSVCASLLFYAGVVMFVIMAAAAILWAPGARRRILRSALAGGGILAGLVLFYLAWGWHNGSLAAWAACLRMEWLDKYFAPEPRAFAALRFLGLFALGCGGIPVAGLLLAWRGGAWERTVATVVLTYLAIILGSGMKNLHYLGPLLVIVNVLWLQPVPIRHSSFDIRHSPFALLLTTASFAICLVLCWPLERPTFTLNRDFGQLTTFQTDSYEEAVLWARIAEPLYEQELLGWQIGQHTWVGYSERAGRLIAARPLVVTTGEPPSAEYELVFESNEGPTAGVKLYCRDEEVLGWMADQRPWSGVERCPWVFRGIAIAPQSRDQGSR
jgi:hypothetical protein